MPINRCQSRAVVTVQTLITDGGNMSGWQIADNVASMGLELAPAFGAIGGIASRQARGPIQIGSGCFVAGTLVRIFHHVPIQQVPLGSRIAAVNPQSWDYDTSLPEPDAASWSRIELTITRSDRAVVDVELLRPDQWILDRDLFVGTAIPLRIEELRVHGVATVTALSACPDLAWGNGECVTGRFVTRRVDQTVRITLIDGTQLEGTPVHPVWSVGSDDFVPMSELAVGDRLQTATGPMLICRVEVRHRPVPVYNIEVRGSHVYEVTAAGILVHNAGDTCLYRGDDFFNELVGPKGPKSHMDAAGNLVPANPKGMYQTRGMDRPAKVTIADHVLGSYRRTRKANSPFTSFTRSEGLALRWSPQTGTVITIDLAALNAAIKRGEVTGVAIHGTESIVRALNRLPDSNYKARALSFAVQMQEVLIRGTVPAKYIN